MPTQFSLSPINKDQMMYKLENFDVLIEMARSMKNCHYFYATANSRLLYGVNETPGAIKILELPLHVGLPVNIKFKLSGIDADYIKTYKHFGFYTPEVIYPLGVEITSETPMVCLVPMDRSDYLTMQHVMETIYRFQAVASSLSLYPSVFGNMENHPVVQEVFSNKITEGAKYLHLVGMNNKHYGFMIWRNLFSLNKGDKLTIKIYDKIDDGRLFQVRFIVEKKKSPIPAIKPHYIELAHAMYINI